MYKMSRFSSTGGMPDELEVESWAEGYFQNIVTLLNSFFTQVEPKEALARMEIIPFDKMVADELEGESEEIINIAVAKIKELMQIEFEFMRAYLK